MSGTPYFQMYIDANFEYRWRFVASNGRIICASCEGYKNSADCQHSIELVKRDTPPAAIFTP